NCMRPRVGGKKLVVIAKALAEVGGEPVVHGAAVGEVRVHVAEGDAAGVVKGRRSRVASGIKAWESANERLGLGHASGLARQIEAGGNRGIQSSRPEEIGQRGVNVRQGIAGDITAADREWAGWNGAAGHGIVRGVVGSRSEICG